MAGQDRISGLYDEILILILSFLSIMDAGRTCVLSKRWTTLWKHLRCIRIDCNDSRLRRFPDSNEHVNQILGLHQGSSVDELKIRSPFAEENVDGVDKWIEFAVQKRVKKLELDLEGPTLDYSDDGKFKFLENRFTFLTYLSLNYVNLSCATLRQILSQCSLLEHICVRGSTDLFCATVIGSALRLKSLQISQCVNLVRVKISAPNLVSFIYEGVGSYRFGVIILHAPSLVNVELREKYDCTTKSFGAISDYYSQLVTLTLDLILRAERKVNLPEFGEFTSLRDLSITVDSETDEQSLLMITSLIEKSPLLQSFTIQIKWKFREPRLTRSILHIPESPHRCLKVVKFTGFIGVNSVLDNELAIYLIHNAVALEKLIFHIETNTFREPNIVKIARKIEARRQWALRFGARLPPGAELIVL